MDVNSHTSILESYQLEYFSMRHLLNYVNFMNKARLMHFMDALKCRVLDKIAEFNPAYREELEVLCQLTDESLTENGKKIITKRMLTIVNRTSFMKKEESDPRSDCVLSENPQHDITQEEMILESLFNCRMSGKIDSLSKSEIKSSVDRSANIYKSHNKHASLGNLNGVKETLKKEMPESIEGYNSSFSTNGFIHAGKNRNIREIPDGIEGYDSNCSKSGCISAVVNGNIKKEMPDSIEGYDSSFSTNGCISTDETGNIKKEIPESIKGNDSSFSTNDYISTGENVNIKKEIPDSLEAYNSSFSTNSCISAFDNGNSDIKVERNVSSKYAATNTHLSCTLNKPRIKRHYKSGANAREFVNRNRKKSPSKVDVDPSSVDDSTYSHFSLNDLLNYDVHLMPSTELKNYANSLKLRLLENFFEFGPSDKEELKVFCKLLDDSPTDSKKKIICSRICALVSKTIPNKQCNRRINRTIFRYHKQSNSGS